MSLRTKYHEEEPERVARYLNGLKYSIQDEISILSPDTVRKCYQIALREDKKIKRKSNQSVRGRGIGNNFKGKGKFGGRGQPYKGQGESSSSEQGGSNFRGGFK